MAEAPPEGRPQEKRARSRAGDSAPSDGLGDAAPTADEETRRLQHGLAALGLFTEPADGIDGPATAEAVRRFQAMVGLPTDGVAGPQTFAELDRILAQTLKTAPGDAEAAPEAAPPPAAVTFLFSKEDTPVVGALSGLVRGPDDSIEVSTVAIEAGEPPQLRPGELAVVFLSRAFVAFAGTDDQERILDALAASGGRVAPVLLEEVDLVATAFGRYQALAAAEPLAHARDRDAWLRRVADEVRALVRPQLARRELPRFSADSLDGVDLLERRDKIEFLASVLAAKQLETPLAIGLFGDWGSGKSFFMRRLQERIVGLTEASVRAEQDGRPTLYCSHIRHVTFNAWLHSGSSEIWPAFAAQVFRSVCGLETEAPQGEIHAESLVEYQGRLREREAREERIRELRRQIGEKQAELDAIEPPKAGAAGTFVASVREIGVRLLGLRNGWRDLRTADLLLLGAIVAALVGFWLFDGWMSWAVTIVPAVLSVLRYLDEPRRLRGEVRELKEELAKEEKERPAVADAPAELLLPEFARLEAEEWAKRAEFDTVTQIRMKFERLSQLIADGLAAQDSPSEKRIPVPIGRVIVYVDDLDRCQPRVVVAVLETLKLLLSVPHFVAVVGVDSRWLFRSLELHFRDLLHGDDGADGTAWEATPQNYLEKIFQYSLVLQPITEAGFENLIEELLAPPPEPGSTAPGEAAPAARDPEPAHANPAPAGAAQPAAEPPAPDLTPAELVITREEVDFIRGLGSLFETPRAAKRLANVYRLLRVSVGAERLMRDEDYEAALLLLAIGIGFPRLAGEVFASILRSPELPWPAFVDGLSEDGEAARRLKVRLSRASPRRVADRTLESFATWIPVVAEFSFHPWQELRPAADGG